MSFVSCFYTSGEGEVVLMVGAVGVSGSSGSLMTTLVVSVTMPSP